MENCAKSLLELTTDNVKDKIVESVSDKESEVKGLPMDKGKGKALVKRGSKSKVADNTGKKSKTEGPSSVASAPSTSKDNDSELASIKDQLSTLLDLVPVVKELKMAYDSFNEMETENEIISPTVTESQENSNDCIEGNGEATYSVDYFKGVAGTVVSEGPTINEDIATGVANILQSGLEATKLRKIKEDYITPKNCTRLKEMECNQEIIKMVSNQVKLRDAHLKKVQNTLLKGLTAAVHAFNTLNDMTSLSEEGRGAVKMIADATALIADSSHSLDISRRYLFKGELKEEFSMLCTDSYPVNSLLFGEQLPEKIKDVYETQKMSQKMTKTKRYEPYYAGSHSGRRFPFLGQRSPFGKKGRGGGQYRNKYQPNQQHINYSHTQNFSSQQRGRKVTRKQ